MTTTSIGPIVLALLSVAAAAWPAHPARAQAMTIRAGETKVLATFFEIDRRTCQTLASPNVYMVTEPSIGRAHIGQTTELHSIRSCRPQVLPVNEVIYHAPLDAAGKFSQLAYSANFQQLHRNHSRKIDIVILP